MTATTTRVCSYWHDHMAGDPSFEDCEAAAASARALAQWDFLTPAEHERWYKAQAHKSWTVGK
jgi:hypothetical protein